MEETEDDPQSVGSVERAKGIASIEILLRILRKAADCFEGDDLETVVVLLTVAAASSGKYLRDFGVLEALGTSPLPDHLLRPTSGRSIAESTGLPRETVRRRLQALVADGRILRDARGYRTLSGGMTMDRNMEFVRFMTAEMTAASQRLARF